MRLDRKHLMAALKAAHSIAPKRTPRANLREALLEESFGEVRLSATDLSRGIGVGVAGDAESGERLMLPVEEALAALGSVSDDAVLVRAVEPGRTVLEGGGARWSFSTSDVADSGAHRGPTGERPIAAEVAREALAEAVRLTAWAAGSVDESSRWALNCAEVEVRDGEVVVVASSVRTAAEARFAAPGAAAAVVHVDAGALAAAVEVLSGERVTIRAGDDVVEVASGGDRAWALGSRLRFPSAVRDMLSPKGDPVALDAGALREIVQRARQAVLKGSSAIDVEVADGYATASHANVERAAHGGKIAAKGPDGRMAVDGALLLAALAGIDGEARLWFPASGAGAAFVRCEARQGWTALVMTMTYE